MATTTVTAPAAIAATAAMAMPAEHAMAAAVATCAPTIPARAATASVMRGRGVRAGGKRHHQHYAVHSATSCNIELMTIRTRNALYTRNHFGKRFELGNFCQLRWIVKIDKPRVNSKLG
jgi:hypothetical protein